MILFNRSLALVLFFLVGSLPVVRAASATLDSGKRMTLTVSAQGTMPFSYQWYRNGVALAGETSSTLVIESAQQSDAGSYTARVSNSAGSVLSDVGSVVVKLVTSVTAPIIVLQPTGGTFNAGSDVTLAVTATGLPLPTYQWRKDGVAISGATGATYRISDIESNDAATYSVVVKNSSGSTTSQNAVVAVRSAPVLTQHPTSATIAQGGSVSFTAAATANPAPTYQWQKDGKNISGATSAKYTISNAGSNHVGTYVVVVSNTAGAVTSKAATLALATAAPVITQQPTSQTVASGNSVTFKVVANSASGTTYQWSKDGVALSGAQSATLTLSSAKAASSGTYAVKVTNSAGSVTSKTATLTVGERPVITAQPASRFVKLGAAVSFTGAASGSPAPKYQWSKDGVAIAGATSATYNIASVGVDDIGLYTLSVTNNIGTVVSQEAKLTTFITTDLSASGADFNFDGWTDLIWHNTSTQECTVWFMNGTTQIGSGKLGTAAAGWTIEGTGDFNGDGYADLLWRNAKTGENRVWIQSGVLVASVKNLPSRPSAWAVAAVGDFNADGVSDIVWRNTSTREYGVSLISAAGKETYKRLGTAAAGLEIHAAGDFNGDGNADLVWYNTSTYEVRVEKMNNLLQSAGTLLLGSSTGGWEIAGIGDFNGDGKSDLLLQSTGGTTQVWLWNGTAVSGKVNITVRPLVESLRN